MIPLQQIIADTTEKLETILRGCLPFTPERQASTVGPRAIASAASCRYNKVRAVRAYLEAYAIGRLCPAHIGLGALRQGEGQGGE